MLPHFALYLVKISSLKILDSFIMRLVRDYPDLEPKITHKKHGLKDWAYLVSNSFIEYAFATYVILREPAVKNDGFLLIQMLQLLLVNDLFYYSLHRAMHKIKFLHRIHAHHHRDICPHKGYIDAGNEHPAEQLMGLSCCMLSIFVTNPARVVLLAFLVLYASVSILNHTNKDITVLCYSVKHHREHHMRSNVHFAQYLGIIDLLFSTSTF